MSDAGHSEEVDRWLLAHRALAIDGLRSLVQTPSVTGDEGALQRQLAVLLQDFGIDVTLREIDDAALESLPGYLPSEHAFTGRPNVVATLPGRGGGKALLLIGHADVVPAGAGWRHDPWGGAVEDDRVYGRGAADAKGGIWAAALAAAALRATAAPLAGDLIIASAAEEETTGNGALALCQTVQADGIVVLEPTDGAVCYGHQGVFGLHVDVPGIAAHGARRSTENAVVRAAEVVLALERLHERWAAPLAAGYPPPVVNVARIAGGDDLFTVPAQCVVEATVRYPPGYEQAVQRDVLEAAGRTWPTSSGMVRAGATISFSVAAAHTPADHPLIQMLLSVSRSVRPAEPAPFPATCDARHFAARGLPVAIYGPGSLDRAHGADEYLMVDELLDAARILARLALRWCGPLARGASSA